MYMRWTSTYITLPNVPTYLTSIFTYSESLMGTQCISKPRRQLCHRFFPYHHLFGEQSRGRSHEYQQRFESSRIALSDPPLRLQDLFFTINAGQATATESYRASDRNMYESGTQSSKQTSKRFGCSRNGCAASSTHQHCSKAQRYQFVSFASRIQPDQPKKDQGLVRIIADSKVHSPLRILSIATHIHCLDFRTFYLCDTSEFNSDLERVAVNKHVSIEFHDNTSQTLPILRLVCNTKRDVEVQKVCQSFES